MPSIKQSYQINNISLDNLYEESFKILKELGAINIDENIISPKLKELRATIPSIWGWGGMNIFVRLEEENNNVLLTLEGYIAQLGITPLTKKMDEFLKNLQSILKTKYNYSFTYQKLTRFLPSYKISINKTDKILFVVIIIVTFFSTLLDQLGGPWFAFFLTSIIVLIGYYLGRKYLLKKSK